MAELTSATGRVLVLNAGSATVKATVLDLPDVTPGFERTVAWPAGGPDSERRAVIDGILDAAATSGGAPDTLDVVAHRVVHGGERFTTPTVLDDAVVATIESLADLAPVHTPLAVAAMRSARDRIRAIPHVALFDTAFHSTMPEAARRYPIPLDWEGDHGIRRFGFHGLSVEWSVGRSATLLGRPAADLRLIVAHLGGGCSVTAVDGGRSVATSMGLTPLEGLMMGTRAGSIDPGIVFALLRAGIDADEIERRLEYESGLLGVGGTSDMQALNARAASGDARAALAIELFVRGAAAGIAAAATVLPSLDAVVFTAGIGEHATAVRVRICERLRASGVPVPLDEPADDDATDRVLARSDAGVAVLRVHAREDLVMGRSALAAIDPLSS